MVTNPTELDVPYDEFTYNTFNSTARYVPKTIWNIMQQSDE